MQQNFEKKRKLITPAFCFNKSLHQQSQNSVSNCLPKSGYSFNCFNAKHYAFSKAYRVVPSIIFEKKLHALVPKQVNQPYASCFENNQANSDQKENVIFEINSAYCSESLKSGPFNILLVKASSGTTGDVSQFQNVANKSCFSFNIVSNVQIMVNKFGKTNFSKKFVNHFYSKHNLEYFKLNKLSGASIDVLNICCTNPQLAAPNNGFNKCLIKAQCSSLAAVLFLKTMVFNKAKVLNSHFAASFSYGGEDVFKGGTAIKPLINKQLLANKAMHNSSFVRNERQQHVLETMKVVLGAYLITHKNIWFISANELKQCCLLIVNSEQNGLVLNAAPVGVITCLKKSVNNSVVICNKLLTKLIILLNQMHLKKTRL